MSAQVCPEVLAAKEVQLRELLRQASPLLVAYSGGVDSATLLAVACETPGVIVLGILADSPSLPRTTRQAALDEAARQGWPVETLATHELADPRYAANPVNRCYFCKAELFSRMAERARAGGFRALAYGENADDVAEERPGSRAAAEFQVLAPLRIVGLGKAEVRALARARGLAMTETPAQPCLSSRIGYGVPVTPSALALIEAAEAELQARQYRIYRVRLVGYTAGERETPHSAKALVQVSPAETPRLLQERAAVCAALQRVGFAEVECDPLGYRGPSLGA